MTLLLTCYYRYPSDDINKFLWMVRIGGGVFPDIKEKDYLANGQYRIDGEVTKARTLTHASVCVMPCHHCQAAAQGYGSVSLSGTWSWQKTSTYLMSMRSWRRWMYHRLSTLIATIGFTSRYDAARFRSNKSC